MTTVPARNYCGSRFYLFTVPSPLKNTESITFFNSKVLKNKKKLFKNNIIKNTSAKNLLSPGTGLIKLRISSGLIKKEIFISKKFFFG